jgi:hypothetical protein
MFRRVVLVALLDFGLAMLDSPHQSCSSVCA